MDILVEQEGQRRGAECSLEQVARTSGFEVRGSEASIGVSRMLEGQPKELSPGQLALLESLLKAGFRFVTFERYARYLGVERDGLVALLETAGGKVQFFGQVGYHVREGIAMLVERGEGKAFLWKGESVAATPELLAGYARFKVDLRCLLHSEAGEREQGVGNGE